jgi:hypothetical protein
MVSREEKDPVDVPADLPAVWEQESEEVQLEASQPRSRFEDAPDTPGDNEKVRRCKLELRL